MVFQKFKSWRLVAFVAFLSLVFVPVACQTERPSPSEPGSDVQLFGLVHGAAGSTVSGATVSIGAHTASSDSTGLYRVTGLSSGHQSVTVKRAAFQDFTKTVDLDRSPANQLDITLVPAAGSGSVIGDVRFDGGPLAQVTMTADGVSTITAADGTFILSGLTVGTVTLIAHRDGFNDVISHVNVGEAAHVVMTARASGPPSGPPGGGSAASLSGTVLAAGAPVAGAVVSAQGQTATTTTDGKYSLTALTSGSASVSVSKSGFTTVTQTVVLTAGANTLDVTLIAGSGGGGSGTSLTGIVTSGTVGSPVVGVTITAQGKTTVTVSDGSYLLSDLNVGNAVLTAKKPGLLDFQTSGTLDPVINHFDIFMKTSSTALSGKIHRPDGPDISGATVTVQGILATASVGRYYVNGLKPGPATVTATAAGFKNFSQATTLTSGDSSFEIVMTPLTP